MGSSHLDNPLAKPGGSQRALVTAPFLSVTTHPLLPASASADPFQQSMI
jgi:hypothetical protein